MKTILSALLFFAVVIGAKSQNQTPYLTTKLVPYPKESNITPSSIEGITYAQLDTGLDSCNIYIGTGKQRGNELYWMKIDYSPIGKTFSAFNLKKDKSMNVCRDTIRRKFKNDEEMIAFELIHDLSTNEMKYIWLDANNNRSEKAVLITIDHPLKKGKMFPDLTVDKLDGEKLAIQDLKGKIVVVNWWSTTCAPCIMEMPGLNRLVDKYADNPDIVFLAIALGNKKNVAAFLEKKEFDYIQTIGSQKAIEIFGTSLPKNIIIDKNGKISYYSSGGHNDKYKDIEREIEKILE